ncbi:hypothetical protein ACLB2K_037983 [Fragaria x ananassa]
MLVNFFSEVAPGNAFRLIKKSSSHTSFFLGREVIVLASGVDTSANCVCWWCSQVRRSKICLSFRMDKSWIALDKNSDEYREGVKQFVLNSKRYARNPKMIICPCAICCNLGLQTDDDLEIHLMRHDVDPDYDIWCAHGEDTGPSIQVVDNESSNHIDVDYELPEVLQMYKDAHYPFSDGAGSSNLVSIEEEYKNKA